MINTNNIKKINTEIIEEFQYFIYEYVKEKQNKEISRILYLNIYGMTGYHEAPDFIFHRKKIAPHIFVNQI